MNDAPRILLTIWLLKEFGISGTPGFKNVRTERANDISELAFPT